MDCKKIKVRRVRKVVLVWMPAIGMWHMLDAKHGKFVQDFPDCLNTAWWFPCLRKDRRNVYWLAQAVKVKEKHNGQK